MEICGQHGDLCNVYCDSFVHFKESYTNKNFIRKTVPKARNNSGFGDGLSIYPFNRPQMTISSSISQLQPNISVSSELSLGLITSFIT